MMRKLIVVLAFIFSLPLAAQTQMEKILLPVVVQAPVPGAAGSLWNTELDLYYAGNQSLRVDGILICNQDPCLDGSDLLERVEYRNVGVFTTAGIAGTFLRIPVTVGHDLAMHLRVFDISRSATNRGTEVPAVHESAAWTTPLQLLDVPTAPPFRSLVRIYDFDPAADHAVAVNIYKLGGLFETRSVALRPPAQDAFPSPELFPGYAEYDLSHLGDLGSNVRVEVVPLSAGPRFWAMASTTNNDTQHVTLTTP
jgi:hypothetical protein